MEVSNCLWENRGVDALSLQVQEKWEEKVFTLPLFDPLSGDSSSPGTRADTRLKVRLAHLQLEREREEREWSLRRELELKKLEADTAVKMRQLKLQRSEATSPATFGVVPPADSTPTFDVSKHISLVPVFRESEVESYFATFERIATALHWPPDVWAILLQCKLMGRAQEACSSLSIEDSLVYEKVKAAMLRLYELVPEAYRQRFRNLKRLQIRHLQTLQERKEFKNCVPERTAIYLNEQKAITLQQAASLADEFAPTQDGVHEAGHVVFYSTEVRQCASCPCSCTCTKRKCCFLGHKPGHIISDCQILKRKQATTTKQSKGVGLIKTVTVSTGQSPALKEPDECFKPFIFRAFVSLTGRMEDQHPITVLRDTGRSQSFILSSTLPLGADTCCNSSPVVRGIEMSSVFAPLHRVHIISKLKTGFFQVAVLSCFPISGVDFIMGNDIAGGKVYPTPKFVDCIDCVGPMPRPKIRKQVGHGQVRSVDEKSTVVLSYPTPTTRRKLQRFLDMAGYYQCLCARTSLHVLSCAVHLFLLCGTKSVNMHSEQPKPHN
ncbi:hypothetical protein L3Q82_009748 [Scortum barcoo]|uniref:Uncharacterized protein n=1 Tax=Scortum barcoo TaxID=214431 RepID=A0ACB8WEY1_9TELE|nr:hypothetical protein L3Q82_009748 [Scortum barcoo]